MDGWIKTYRKLTEWEWYGDLPVRTLFQHLLLIVNYEDKLWRGKLLVKRGQTIISLANLAAGACLTVQQTRTALNKLKLTNEITTESTNEYTIITVCKYAQYQGCDEYEQQTNQQTNNTPINTPNNTPNNTSITTTKEIKNIRRKEDSSNPLTPLKGEGGKTATKFNATKFIENETEETRRILQTWIDFKQKQFNEAYKTEVGFKAFITKLNRLSGNDPEKAAAIIEQSMANNWKGIYDLKNNTRNGTTSNQIDFDRICELSDAMLNYERQQ